jgi:hypothetical protein
MFWNQLVAVTTEEDDVLREPKLVEMRVVFAAELNSITEPITRKNLSLLPAPGSTLSGSVVFDGPHHRAYARNIVERFGEVQEAVSRLNDELVRD